MRLRLRGWLLLCALVRSRAQSPETRWTEWVSGDKAANAHERTRAELQAFSAQCFQMAPYWAAVADVHESLSSVVVFDVRHNWNGLGDSHERLNFILRVGRKLNRASFLWANGAAAAPGGNPDRAPVLGHTERKVRQSYQEGLFDAGTFITGFGGVGWQWTTHELNRVKARHAGEAWLQLQYECMQHAAVGGCAHSVLRFLGNGSEALSVRDDEPSVVARGVLSYLQSLRHPLLRLQLSLQGDLTPESRLKGVCPDARCRQECESFLNWRPKMNLWVALRPYLATLDRWKSFVVLTVRTGGADHFGANFGALKGDGAALRDPTPLPKRLEVLFQPCAADTPLHARDKGEDEKPCVTWHREGQSTQSTQPTLQLAATCGAAASPGGRLFNGSDGPLGAYVDCAARAAQALAAADGQPDSWGVAIFSDAPALKCLLEASPLKQEGHLLVTATAPGHVQYAPSGVVLHNVARLTLVDWFLISLADEQLPVFGSAFGGSAIVRGKLPRRLPEGSGLRELPRGFERWFQAGRENRQGLGVDEGMLALLGETNGQCPITRRSICNAHGMYSVGAEHDPDDCKY